jgi:hypothetical protein
LLELRLKARNPAEKETAPALGAAEAVYVSDTVRAGTDR